MRVVLVSDTHGELPEIPKCDLLIHAGDIAPDYIREYYDRRARKLKVDKGDQRQSNWLRGPFCDWLEDVPAEQVIGIGGNHDFALEQAGLIPENLRWTYLKDETVEVDGLRVHGTPWVPNLPFWAFYASDDALNARASGIPAGLDFLVSHGPPYGYLDDVRAGSKRGNMLPMHVGDRWLTMNLERIGAKYLVCGHIHEGYGRTRCNKSGTEILNVSYMDETYNPINAPVVLDL
jgi:Icc-related predicted phosphoesterase